MSTGMLGSGRLCSNLFHFAVELVEVRTAAVLKASCQGCLTGSRCTQCVASAAEHETGQFGRVTRVPLATLRNCVELLCLYTLCELPATAAPVPRVRSSMRY